MYHQRKMFRCPLSEDESDDSEDENMNWFDYETSHNYRYRKKRRSFNRCPLSEDETDESDENFSYRNQRQSFNNYPYRTEYARSSRSRCKKCYKLIDKDELRIAIMVQSTHFDGKTPQWYHEHCFFSMRKSVTEGDIKHLGNLRYEDQERLRDRINKKYKPNSKLSRKRPHEALSLNNLTPKYPKNSYTLDYAKSGLSVCSICKVKINRKGLRIKNDIIDLEKGSSVECFHVFCFPKQKVAECKDGGESLPGYSLLTLLDQKIVQQCIPKTQFGTLDTSILKLDSNIKVRKTDFESQFKEQNERFYFFKDNLKKTLTKSQQIKILEFNNQKPAFGNRENLANQVADLLSFGALEKCLKCYTGQLYFTNSGFLCIGSISGWTKCGNLEKNPRRTKCLVPESLSDISLLSNIGPPEDRLFKSSAPSESTLREHAAYEKQQVKIFQAISGKSRIEKSVKLTVKGGLAVDPGSGLESICKVFVNGNEKYSVVLGVTDLNKNRNAFYKIQLLVSEDERRFWIYRAWGRTGTSIGGDKTEGFANLERAQANFKATYFEKTGNEWENRHDFVKKPGLFYPIDISYAGDTKVDWESSKATSNLPKATQELIKLIFDIDSMKKTMLEFDLDMEKMPLGKLSKDQINKAFDVLNEISHYIKYGATEMDFIDASNRFYTLIPHNFGMRSPPILNELYQLNDLNSMLNTLLQIECAYKLLEEDLQNQNINPIDKHYQKLNTNLEPIDHNSRDFKMIQTYVQRTHGKTHTQFSLHVEEVFKVQKNSHKKRFKKHLHNRRLLWHGSRLTNFVGILTNGLKIAPPEAPSTGYMFGKGVYFADMVSKSAAYCYTSRKANVGLMLLSEVALGNMLELTKAHFISQLPDGKHSVLGKGRTSTDPFDWETREEDGCIIPYGNPVEDDTFQTDLLYNEYIVYDESQIDTQYLVKMKFNYNF